MVLPLIVLGVSTVVALAVPFFFPTPAEKATVELNNKLKTGSFLTRDGSKPQTGASRVSSAITQITDNKQIILLLAIVLIFIVVVIR